LRPSFMIRFSTLPHQSTTPLLPAGTITKVPQRVVFQKWRWQLLWL
jgi:hypothetical protein